MYMLQRATTLDVVLQLIIELKISNFMIIDKRQQ